MANAISKRPIWTVPYTPPTSTCKNILWLAGSGNSGSGALVDYLREFDSVTQAIDGRGYPEVDFLRRYGGVFNLALAFLTQNRSVRSFMLKNFITMSEYYYLQGGIYSDEFMRLTREFSDNLTKAKTKTPTGCEGDPAFLHSGSLQSSYANLEDPFCYDLSKDRYIYTLEDLTLDEYYQMVQEYLHKFFNSIQSNEILLCFQLLSGVNEEFEVYEKVLGKFKTIYVIRDPRDIYASGIVKNLEWIPKDIKTFIPWYKEKNHLAYKEDSENFIKIRFEDFVLDHSNTGKKVCDFLEIDESGHKRKGMSFQPEVSAKNIARYKKLKSQVLPVMIEKELSEFCYYG